MTLSITDIPHIGGQSGTGNVPRLFSPGVFVEPPWILQISTWFDDGIWKDSSFWTD